VTPGSPSTAIAAPRPDAWVVFADEVRVPWLRMLRPGFRHCFLLLRQEPGLWITMDPAAGWTQIAVHPAHALDARYEAAGLTVVRAPPPMARTRPAPVALFTCVEAVKRALGIHARLIVTPYQLYRHLQRLAACA
jgi:hypothetical protein